MTTIQEGLAVGIVVLLSLVGLAIFVVIVRVYTSGMAAAPSRSDPKRKILVILVALLRRVFKR